MSNFSETYIVDIKIKSPYTKQIFRGHFEGTRATVRRQLKATISVRLDDPIVTGRNLYKE